jgi:hypothetical protein
MQNAKVKMQNDPVKIYNDTGKGKSKRVRIKYLFDF